MADPTAVCLRPLLAVLTVDRVLGAIRYRVPVARRATDRIACRSSKGGANQNDGGSFLEHDYPPLRLNQTRLRAKRSIPAPQFPTRLSAKRHQTATGAEMWGCGS